MVMKILVELFSSNECNRTRGYETALVKEQCRLDMRKYSFSQKTIMIVLMLDCVYV